ncbi:MAG: zincin-like metallopeptidase domain-containing protein [Desulfuromonadales bacterium]
MTNKSHDTKSSVTDLITEMIIKKLESGTIPWRKPWNGSETAPKNLVTGKPYRGINAFILGCAGSTWFATYNQIQEKHGSVKKGAKSIPVIFWSIKPVADHDTGDDINIPILRYYRVFAIEDIIGIDAPVTETTIREFSPIEAAERVVADMPQRPEIKHGEAKAYYSPSLDYINMPKRELFHSDEEYYSTLFHELGHATGHSNRLNRSSVTKSSYFGSSEYSKEELIAECCSAFISSETNIVTATIDNSAAYIKGWLSALKSRDNRGMIIHAAAAGQRAADFILNRHSELAGS